MREALEGHGFTVCGEAGNATTAIDLAVRQRPDVCLLDINMPGNGIHAAAEISVKVRDAVVVMLTVSRSDTDLFDALRVCAAGVPP